jgi:hypothetical protein
MFQRTLLPPPEDGGSKVFQNIGILSQLYIASQPKRPHFGFMVVSVAIWLCDKLVNTEVSGLNIIPATYYMLYIQYISIICISRIYPKIRHFD